MRTIREMKEMDRKKEMSALLGALLAMIILAAPVMGADWVGYSGDDEGNAYSFKIEKVSRGKGRHQVTVIDMKTFSTLGRKKHIQDLAQFGFSTAGYDKLHNLKVQVEIDCRKKSSRALTLTKYDTAGKALYTQVYEKPEWTFMQPGSIWDVLRLQVCN